MRYKLGRHHLRNSKNEYIATLVRRKFIVDDDDFPTRYVPADAIRNDMARKTEFNNFSTSHPQFKEIIGRIADNSEAEIEALVVNVYPNELEQQKKAVKKIHMAMSDLEVLQTYLNENHKDMPLFCQKIMSICQNRNSALRELLSQEFPHSIAGGASAAELLLQYFQQNPQYYATGMPYIYLGQDERLENGARRLGIQAHKTHVRIYPAFEQGEHRVFYDTDIPEMAATDLETFQAKVFAGCTWRFELTTHGFEFVEVIAHGENMRDLIMGESPKDLDWFKEIPDHFHQFSKEVKSAYRRSPFSRPFRFVFEFLPHLIEILTKVQSEFLIYHYPDQYDIADWPVRVATQALLIFGVAALDVVHYAAKSIRLLGGCLVSPLRSYNEATQTHLLLGVVSAVTSVALFVGVGALLTPLMTSQAFASASAWVIAHTGAVGTFMESVGMQVAGLFGESVSAATVGTMTLAASFFAVVLLPVFHYISKRWEHELKPKVKIDIAKIEGANAFIAGDDKRIVESLKKNPPPELQKDQDAARLEDHHAKENEKENQFNAVKANNDLDDQQDDEVDNEVAFLPHRGV